MWRERFFPPSIRNGQAPRQGHTYEHCTVICIPVGVTQLVTVSYPLPIHAVVAHPRILRGIWWERRGEWVRTEWYHHFADTGHEQPTAIVDDHKQAHTRLTFACCYPPAIPIPVHQLAGGLMRDPSRAERLHAPPVDIQARPGSTVLADCPQRRARAS